MVITLQNNHDANVVNKLSKIVLKQMNFIGAEHDSAKVDCAIKNALDKNGKSIFFVKINEKEEFIGFVFGNVCSGLETGADYLWINELYVEPEYRRKGIAAEIFTFIERWAKDKGIKYIATMTGEKNKTALKFYKKMSYDLEKVIWVDKSIR